MSETKISIRNLYKIFGKDPAGMVPHVQNGVSKPDLLEQHNHVLGLEDINLDIPASGVQVIMGLSGSGKSTLIRHINRLIEPTAGKMLIDGEDVLAMKPEKKDLTFVKELIEAGKVTPVIDKSFPLSELPEALCYYSEGRSRGKVVVTVAH